MKQKTVIAVATGVLLSVALNYGHVKAHEHLAACCIDTERGMPFWSTIVSAPMYALIALVPGFAAGWIAQRNGLLWGFVTGVLGSATYSALFGTFWRSTAEGGAVEVFTVIGWMLTMGVASGLYAAAAGGSGQLWRLLQPRELPEVREP